MSKLVKKVFKGIKKAVKKVGSFIKKNWKEIVLVTAAVFTAGAALGYVGMSASGGLAFGAGSSAGGLSGIGAAFGGLGNTVTSALGMGNQFGASTIAQGGSSVAGQAAQAGVQANQAAAATAAPKSLAVDSVAKAAVPEAVGGATSAQAVSADIAQKGLLEKMGGLGGVAQAGGLGLSVLGALKQKEEGPGTVAEGDVHEWDAPYEEAYRAAEGDNKGQGLMTPRNYGTMTAKRTNRQSSRDDEARRRYGRGYA